MYAVGVVWGMVFLMPPLAKKSYGSAESGADQKHEQYCPKDQSFAVKNKKLQICYASNGSKNGDIYIMLKEGKKSRCVLTAQGSLAEFVRGKGAYPDVQISWHFSADENPSTLYIWNGHDYEE